MAQPPTNPLLSSRRRDALIVAVAVIGVLVYAIAAQATAHSWGFPLDDSWIHQTYGRNLAQTGHWEYVPGVPSAGSTSPLYTVLLAAGYLLHIPFFLWTDLLGAAALALGGLVGARLAERIFPAVRNAGLWTGLALVTAWHLVWTAASGMETVLFASFGLVFLYLSYREIDPHPGASAGATFGRGFTTGLMGAIVISTRPEGILLIGLVAVAMLVARPHATWREFAVWSAGAVAGGLVGITPYLLLNLSLNGTLLPNTASAKQAENAPQLLRPFYVNLWEMAQPLTAGAQLLLIPGLVVAVWGLLTRLRSARRDALYLVLAVWPFALITLYVLRLPAPYQHGRYVIPALPALIILGLGGTLTVAAPRRAMMLARVTLRSLLITTALLFVVFWGMGAQIFGREVRMIDTDMVVAAQWLRDNIPPTQANLLAVHDIGAVGYFAPRPILDLAGLVSPEVIPIILDRPALNDLMQRRGVRYLMVLETTQKPQVADDGDPRLCLRFNANGEMQAGGMRIYEIAWDGHCKN